MQEDRHSVLTQAIPSIALEFVCDSHDEKKDVP
jgi:hypothetical protein